MGGKKIRSFRGVFRQITTRIKLNHISSFPRNFGGGDGLTGLRIHIAITIAPAPATAPVICPFNKLQRYEPTYLRDFSFSHAPFPFSFPAGYGQTLRNFQGLGSVEKLEMRMGQGSESAPLSFFPHFLPRSMDLGGKTLFKEN